MPVRIVVVAATGLAGSKAMGSLENSVAVDGSPVALYERLGSFGEPELIHEAIPAGVPLLELGAGAGRMTHRLVELGHPVTAVDQAPEMLRRIRGAETVLADIESLDLRRRFPVVLLASNFINIAEDDMRRACLKTCARHVATDGQVLLQGHPPGWEPPAHWGDFGNGISARLMSFTRDGELVDGTMEYVIDGHRYEQSFSSRLFDERALRGELSAVGLRFMRFLDEQETWIEAAAGPALLPDDRGELADRE